MAFKSAMKTVMKSSKRSKIARGRGAKARVFRGKKEKTASGLTKQMLMKSKRGKVVSKKSHASGKKAFKRIQAWVASVKAARKALQFKGFVPIGGRSARGKALYAKSK